ncbi:MAG: hypothetical protein Q6363_002950, partial [Candidatus Njordarchaeota archaeon]
ARRITYLSEDMEMMRLTSDHKLGDAQIKILSTPGYTPGGITVLYGGAIFIGGIVYGGSKGLEFPRQPYDKKLLLDSLRKIAGLEFDSIFPAYGKYIIKNAKQKLSEFLSAANKS